MTSLQNQRFFVMNTSVQRTSGSLTAYRRGFDRHRLSLLCRPLLRRCPENLRHHVLPPGKDLRHGRQDLRDATTHM